MGRALYVNGLFYVMGGECAKTGEAGSVNDPTNFSHWVVGVSNGNVAFRVDIYDPVARRWYFGPNMPVPMAWYLPRILS